MSRWDYRLRLEEEGKRRQANAVGQEAAQSRRVELMKAKAEDDCAVVMKPGVEEAKALGQSSLMRRRRGWRTRAKSKEASGSPRWAPDDDRQKKR